MSGQATSQIKEASRDGAIHDSFEPIPKPGTILDVHGDKITPKQSLMVKLDTKASEKVELSRGTILLFSVGPAILVLILSYGGAVWNKSADDSAVKTRLEAVERAVAASADTGKSEREKIHVALDKLNDKFDNLKDKLNDQAKADAEKKGEMRGFSLRQEADKP